MPSARDRLRGFAALEGIALGIALAMPVTPSKTGSTWSPAELFTPDPGYLLEVLVAFVSVNVILACIGLVAWLVGALRR